MRTVLLTRWLLALVRSADFAPGAGASTTNTFDFDVSTTDMDEASEVEGTYNGADGTYRCNSNNEHARSRSTRWVRSPR